MRASLSLVFALFLAPAWAVKSATSGLNPEALGAKAFLEDLLARRYAQALQTRVDHQSFSVGAQLELTDIPPVLSKPATPPVEEAPLNDLMLGTLDPEDLLKKYSPTDEKPAAQGFLKNFRIKAVTLSVGLSEDLAPEVKGEVEKWLATRLSAEFGKAGKSVVTLIKTVTKKTAPPKSLMELLSDFQSLAGQLVLALAILLGIVLWQVMSKPAGQGAGQDINLNSQTTAGAAGDRKDESRIREEREEKERVSEALHIEKLTTSLVGLLPRLNKEFEGILRAWCQMGETGRLRLATFAEAVGKDLGKLPIPVDAMSEIGKVFSKMSSMAIQEKREHLQKAYWDLLTVMNVGVEALNQPFGYLGGVNVGVVNQLLMDQNPKMKTLVSLFLPDDLRTRYVKSLSSDMKLKLLQEASNLSQIGSQELRDMDSQLAGKLKPVDSNSTVPLEMTLNKVVSALSPIEEVTLLPGLNGHSILEYKRQMPTLAFIAEWPDDKVKLLASRAAADELSTLIRVRPDLRDRVLALSPPLTAEVVEDDLSRADVTSENEKIASLTSLAQRLKVMVQSKEIHLEELIPSGENKAHEPSAEPIDPPNLRVA